MEGHKLYNELAKVYDELYVSIFSYDNEFLKYSTMLRKYKCKKIVEIGCGSGRLSTRFFEKGGKEFDYTGVDIAPAMIEIAKRNNEGKNIRFILGDMRDLQSAFGEERFDAACITGRSFTYMTKNEDVMKCLKSVHSILNTGGVLFFDNFDAEEIFSKFKGKFKTGEFQYENRSYIRESTTEFDLKSGWTWKWNAEYTIKEEGKETRKVSDSTTLRAFLKNELKLFLHLCGFETLEMRPEGSAFLTVAKKKKEKKQEQQEEGEKQKEEA